MSKKAILLAATGLGLLTTAMPVVAQETRTAADESEIIVTARKREESILKVPVIETVLTPAILEKYQINDVTDIASHVPGLQLGNQVLTIGAQVSIRGVGTTALEAGVDQSVSLNLDGLQFSQGLAFKSGAFDLAQVEVLKGPQALFFGKNSPAGVIAIRTADPGDEIEVIGRTGYEFEADEFRNELILSGPVSDTLGLRLATMYSDFQGDYKNIAVAVPNLGTRAPHDRRFGQTKSLIMRGTAVWKPGPEFDARLKLNYTRDRNKGGVTTQMISCPDGTGGVLPSPNIQFMINEDCKRDRKVNIGEMEPQAFSGDATTPPVANDGVPFTNINQKFGTLELNYRPITDITVTSTTGYYKMTSQALISGTTAPITTLSSNNVASRRDFTQELRINSDFSSPLNFTAGAFYQDAKLFNRLIVLTNRELPPPFVTGPTTGALGAVLGNQESTLDIEAFSAFGQLRWQPAPQIEIAGGVRWSHEERSDVAVNRRTGAILNVQPDSISSSNWSPELTITYTPTEDLTLFGSLKQGYKSGSFRVSGIIVPLPNNAPIPTFDFGDEKVQGGEIGLKTRLLDRSLYANIAFYYYKYKGLQIAANQPVASGGVPINLVLNAGAAKVYGVDFDMTYRPPSVPELGLRAAISWNHARFSELTNVPCWGGQLISEGCNLLPNTSGAAGSTDPVTGLPRFNGQDLSGAPLVRAPNWQIMGGVDYEVPLGNGMELGFGVDGQYSSRYLTALGRRKDFYQPGFVKINANVTLKGADNGWELAFIGNNLTNKLIAGSCTNLNQQNGQLLGGLITGATVRGPAGVDEVMCRTERGRELWVRLTVRPVALFGGGDASPAPPPPPPPAPATQTCPDGSVISADSMCPAPPPPPPPEPETTQKAGERG